MISDVRDRMESKDKNEEDYFNTSNINNLLTEPPATTPIMKKIKQIKSIEPRKSSKSV